MELLYFLIYSEPTDFSEYAPMILQQNFQKLREKNNKNHDN